MEALREQNSSQIKHLGTINGESLDDAQAAQVLKKYGGQAARLEVGSVDSEFVGHAIFTVTRNSESWVFKESWDEKAERFQVSVDKTY